MAPNDDRIDLELLACPQCHADKRASQIVYHSPDQLSCSSCHRQFSVRDGLPNFLLDTTIKSELEKNPASYIHHLKGTNTDNTYATWNALLGEFNALNGAYLEIGAGNGFLSNGIIQYSRYEKIAITDISEMFIRDIISKNSDAGRKVDYYICDANHLPFQDNSFDVVVGRSILHHLLHYEKTLGEIFNILKPNGKAFFLEPILQGKLLVAFFLKIIMASNDNQQSGIFTSDQIKKINVLIRHLTKTSRIGSDLEALSAMEDKYIFDVVAIKNLSQKIGYGRFIYKNYCPKDNKDDYPEWGYKQYVFAHVKKFGVTREQLAKFDYLFNSFGETFSDHINHQLYTPMGYFVFEK